MTLYLVKDGTVSEWSGEAINDVRHPKSIETLWTEEELNSVGLYTLSESRGTEPTETQKWEDEGIHLIEGKPVRKFKSVDKTTEELTQELTDWRNSAKVYKLAFKRALHATPFDANNSILQAVEAEVVQKDNFDPLRIVWENVTQFERGHPDMEGFRIQLGLTKTQMDDLFKLAMAIERGEV